MAYAWRRLSIEKDPDGKKHIKTRKTATQLEIFIIDLLFWKCRKVTSKSTKVYALRDPLETEERRRQTQLALITLDRGGISRRHGRGYRLRIVDLTLPWFWDLRNPKEWVLLWWKTGDSSPPEKECESV